MWWWIGGIAVWILSAVWIFAVMADVFRQKYVALGRQAMGGYAFHGVTAVLSLWLILKALGH